MQFGCNLNRVVVAGMLVGFVVLGVLRSAESPEPLAAPPTDQAAPQPAHPLKWDAMEKTIEPKLGDGAADFRFSVTNVSDKTVTIEQIRPSCGCTVAQMPSTPWVLAPGATGSFVGTIDFRGKEGTISKGLYVNSSAGTQMLTITVKIPAADDSMRLVNQRVALANRQAVFHGDCAKCHVEPAAGRTGAELFMAACAVCHFAERRASMVPDLTIAKQHRDAAYWRNWISEGKEGTLMPAWAKDHGGPLTKEQIESIVQFAMTALPTDPPPAATNTAAPKVN